MFIRRYAPAWLCGFALLVVSVQAEGAQTSQTQSDADITASFYEHLVAEDQASWLNLFLTKFPKGGDIHHHYAGSVYAETLLDWLAEQERLVDSCTLRIVEKKRRSKEQNAACPALTVGELRSPEHYALYRKLLMLWSTKDWDSHYHEQLPGDTTFFNTFGYFISILDDANQRKGLEIMKARALAENLSYLETMLLIAQVPVSRYFSESRREKINEQFRQAESAEEIDEILERVATRYEKAPGRISSINKIVRKYVEAIERDHEGIDDDKFTMRYQAFAVRTQDPLTVFTELFAGYLVAQQSELVVGVNIVAPEHDKVSLEDYRLHMHFYRFLRERYPDVGRALHAGELTLGMVKPEDLRFHIREAVDVAGAQRIGHGIDLPYEKDPLGLLAAMKERDIAVEINLTSNEMILGVKGKAHPYLIYEKYGVPLVISTDDAGVSRNNLSHEYVLLARRYGPSYGKLKEYAYNSIHYSFLKAERKAEVKKQLEVKFSAFEREMAQLAKKVMPGLAMSDPAAKSALRDSGLQDKNSQDNTSHHDSQGENTLNPQRTRHDLRYLRRNLRCQQRRFSYWTDHSRVSIAAWR